MSSIRTVPIAGRDGVLELLCSLPTDTTLCDKSPLLFIHGSFCSARCYMNFLPYLAAHGYPAYALSIRGHGASWAQNKYAKMFFTTMHSWAEDIRAALDYIVDVHQDAPPPVLAGHSLGGGILQHMLSEGLLGTNKSSPRNSLSSRSCGSSTSSDLGLHDRISALILLGAAPLSGGGKDIMAHWGKVDAPDATPHFFSDHSSLRTPQQVRASFFSQETKEETVLQWLKMCRTAQESARVGLGIFKSLGEADKVLDALSGVGTPGRTRRVLCIAGSVDKLVPPSMVLGNAIVYEEAAAEAGMDEESCMAITIKGSAHHLMMDAHWETCASAIINWLEGENPLQL